MRGGAVEDEKEVFAREFGEVRKVFVKLVKTRNVQTGVVDGVLVALRMDVNSIESVGKDMIKIRTEEGCVFVVRTGGKFMEVQGEDEARAGMEKEFLLPLGWMPSSGRRRCRCRTWARSGLEEQLLESLGRLCIEGLRWDLFLVIFCSGMCIGTVAGFWIYKFDSVNV